MRGELLKATTDRERWRRRGSKREPLRGLALQREQHEGERRKRRKKKKKRQKKRQKRHKNNASSQWRRTFRQDEAKTLASASLHGPATGGPNAISGPPVSIKRPSLLQKANIGATNKNTPLPHSQQTKTKKTKNEDGAQASQLVERFASNIEGVGRHTEVSLIFFSLIFFFFFSFSFQENGKSSTPSRRGCASFETAMEVRR